MGRILRFDGVERRLDNPPPPAVMREIFPRETHHGWKFIAFGPDGSLLVSDDHAGAIYRITYAKP